MSPCAAPAFWVRCNLLLLPLYFYQNLPIFAKTFPKSSKRSARPQGGRRKQRNASHLLRLNFTSLNSFATLTKEHHAGNRKAVEAVAKHKCFAMEKIFLRKFLPVSSINTKHSSVAKQPRSVLNIKFFVQLS